jgi:hypothetical protein
MMYPSAFWLVVFGFPYDLVQEASKPVISGEGAGKIVISFTSETALPPVLTIPPPQLPTPMATSPDLRLASSPGASCRPDLISAVNPFRLIEVR